MKEKEENRRPKTSTWRKQKKEIICKLLR